MMGLKKYLPNNFGSLMSLNDIKCLFLETHNLIYAILSVYV